MIVASDSLLIRPYTIKFPWDAESTANAQNPAVAGAAPAGAATNPATATATQHPHHNHKVELLHLYKLFLPPQQRPICQQKLKLDSIKYNKKFWLKFYWKQN